MYSIAYFFDVGSGICLWAKNDLARQKYGYPIDHRALPFDEFLKNDIQDLLNYYDTSLDWDNPPGPSPWAQTQWDAFYRAKQKMYERIIFALGEEYEVIDRSRDKGKEA